MFTKIKRWCQKRIVLSRNDFSLLIMPKGRSQWRRYIENRYKRVKILEEIGIELERKRLG